MSVVLSTHTQGLQLGQCGFNMDKWHIKVAGSATATAWGLAQMGQPCPSVFFSSLCLLQPLFFCTDACQMLSFAFLSLIAPLAPILWLPLLPSLFAKPRHEKAWWQRD